MERTLVADSTAGWSTVLNDSSLRRSILNLRGAQTQEKLTNMLNELSLIATEKETLQDSENNPNFCDRHFQ